MLSEYQQAVVDEIHNPTNQHLRIEAVAGSGKTHTIEAASRELEPLHRGLYLAFNKRNVIDIQQRIGKPDDRLEISTFNACGFRCLRDNLDFNVQVDANKTYLMLDHMRGIPDTHEFRGAVSKLVGLAKNSLFTPGDAPGPYFDMLDHMGMVVDDTDLVVETAMKVIRDNWQFTEERNVIDFDDQLYIPILSNMDFRLKTHIFVDESQDTNPANFEMVRRMCSRNGRIFLVGDSHQAIYGFRGAAANAMAKMSDELNAKPLPLPVTYRCATNIVQAAQRFVPHIQAAPGAPEGLVETVDYVDLGTLGPQDLVVCRLNAPLLSVAFRMLRRQLPFQLLGKDLKPRLKKTINKVAKKTRELPTAQFLPRLSDYIYHEAERLRAKKLYGMIGALEDEQSCIATLAEQVGTVGELLDLIEALFQSNYGTRICSVHKSKGAEAPTTVILDADKFMPLPKASMPWELQQEDNIHYVAITRAKTHLLYAQSEVCE